jgi:hypothetical protein
VSFVEWMAWFEFSKVDSMVKDDWYPAFVHEATRRQKAMLFSLLRAVAAAFLQALQAYSPWSLQA